MWLSLCVSTDKDPTLFNSTGFVKMKGSLE